MGSLFLRSLSSEAITFEYSIGICGIISLFLSSISYFFFPFRCRSNLASLMKSIMLLPAHVVLAWADLPSFHHTECELPSIWALDRIHYISLYDFLFHGSRWHSWKNNHGLEPETPGFKFQVYSSLKSFWQVTCFLGPHISVCKMEVMILTLKG